MKRRHAVCVGINDYPGSGADLAGCVNDARDWEGVLSGKGYKVVTLLDSAATKFEIAKAIRDGLRDLKFGDRFVFQFSGHGTWVPDRDGDEADQRDEALCCYDYANGGLLTDDEMHALFQARARGVRVTVISDSCHSGTVARLMMSPGAQMVTGKAKFLPPSQLFDDLTEERAAEIERTTRNAAPRSGTILFSGCQDHEYSYDASFGGRPNGAFTFHALSPMAKGTVKSAYEAIRVKLPAPQYPQTPQLSATAYQKRTAAL